MLFLSQAISTGLILLPTLAAALTPRLTPPAGALVVRKSPAKGEYATIGAAVKAAGTGSNAVTIFINSGTYAEQVYINRPGKTTLLGYTGEITEYAHNQVTITAGASISSAGSDDASGTLRIHQGEAAIYNLNIVNTRGKGEQAIALSAYGNRLAVYGCQLKGYQDTLLTESGLQYYHSSLIVGGVDYVFGQYSQAVFRRCVFSSIGPGSITASGRNTNDAGIYLIDSSYIQLDASAASGTAGKVFLGRPWYPWARVQVQYSSIGSHVSTLHWDTWNGSTDTKNVAYTEFSNSGAGASTAGLAKFAKVASAAISTSSVLGSDYKTWVDAAWLS